MAFSFNYTCYKYEPLIIDRYFVSFLEQDLKNICSYIATGNITASKHVWKWIVLIGWHW